MCDDDDRAVFRQVGEGALYEAFRFRVQGSMRGYVVVEVVYVWW